VAALFRRMREVWSELRVEDMEVARVDETVFVTATLHLTARATGKKVVQPFAEVLHFREDRLIRGTPIYYDTQELVTLLSANSPARSSGVETVVATF
jgi:ketosteroid isomerase-like protein